MSVRSSAGQSPHVPLERRNDPHNTRVLVHSNTIEGVFSVFKRGMAAVYQHRGEAHLHRYLAEFDLCNIRRAAHGVNDVALQARSLPPLTARRRQRARRVWRRCWTRWWRQAQPDGCQGGQMAKGAISCRGEGGDAPVSPRVGALKARASRQTPGCQDTPPRRCAATLPLKERVGAITPSQKSRTK